jgi:hypothetical protein
MSIHITNLTQEQVELLDAMWSLGTLEEYEEWYDLLAEPQQAMANSLQRLLLLEVADQLMTDTTEATEYLQRFRLK